MPPPPAQAAWRSLPPVQRTLPAPALVTSPDGFPDSLVSWRDPTLHSGIGHLVSPTAPSGLGYGLAAASDPETAPASAPASPRELPQPARPWWWPGRVVQRVAAPGTASRPAPAPGPLPGSVPEPAAVSAPVVVARQVATPSLATAPDLAVPPVLRLASVASAVRSTPDPVPAPASDDVPAPGPVTDFPAPDSPGEFALDVTDSDHPADITGSAESSTLGVSVNTPDPSHDPSPGPSAISGVRPAASPRRLGLGAPVQRVPDSPGPAATTPPVRGAADPFPPSDTGQPARKAVQEPPVVARQPVVQRQPSPPADIGTPDLAAGWAPAPDDGSAGTPESPAPEPITGLVGGTELMAGTGLVGGVPLTALGATTQVDIFGGDGTTGGNGATGGSGTTGRNGASGGDGPGTGTDAGSSHSGAPVHLLEALGTQPSPVAEVLGQRTVPIPVSVQRVAVPPAAVQRVAVAREPGPPTEALPGATGPGSLPRPVPPRRPGPTSSGPVFQASAVQRLTAQDSGQSMPGAGSATDAASDSTVARFAEAAPDTAATSPEVAVPAMGPVEPAALASTQGAGSSSPTDVDALVRRLYEPIARRLKAELRLDRERAGYALDLRHQRL